MEERLALLSFGARGNDVIISLSGSLNRPHMVIPRCSVEHCICFLSCVCHFVLQPLVWYCAMVHVATVCPSGSFNRVGVAISRGNYIQSFESASCLRSVMLYANGYVISCANSLYPIQCTDVITSDFALPGYVRSPHDLSCTSRLSASNLQAPQRPADDEVRAACMASVRAPASGVAPDEAAALEAPAGAAQPGPPAGVVAAGAAVVAGIDPTPGAAALPGGAPDTVLPAVLADVLAAALAVALAGTAVAPERLKTCRAHPTAQQRAACSLICQGYNSGHCKIHESILPRCKHLQVVH